MIRHMVNSLTAAALCMGPITSAKAASIFGNENQNAKQTKKPDLISAWDIAPLFLFTGSALYMYTVKKQCNTLEAELKKQNERFDNLEKKATELSKAVRAHFPASPDEEDEKKGFSHDYIHVKAEPTSSSLTNNIYPNINSKVYTDPVAADAPAAEEGHQNPSPLLQAEEPDSDLSDIEGGAFEEAKKQTVGDAKKQTVLD